MSRRFLPRVTTCTCPEDGRYTCAACEYEIGRNEMAESDDFLPEVCS